ncbi:MAG TPA: hotdog domain-containing protein [Acidimicrobiales bacterium]|nr:hotdog domain-containing protein [Acidimicrobiales bacterium]
MTADAARRAPHPAVDGRPAELRALADAIRDLIDATVTTDAPAQVTADVARRVDELTAALREHTPDTPYPRFVFTPDDVEETALADRMPFDAVIGAYNPIALPVDVAVVDGKAIGRATFTTPFEGPPGCVQGGVIAATFDIVLSAANRAAQAAGPTVSLTMRYRRPTLLHRELVVECEVVETDGRRTRSVGRIVQDGEVTVEAEGVFAVVDPKTIASFRAR